MEIYNTHKFLFTINYEDRVKGHMVLFVDRDNKEKKIELSKIDIGASPVSCKLYDLEGKRYLVPFLRIKGIYYKETMVWDAEMKDDDNVKIIKGYK